MPEAITIPQQLINAGARFVLVTKRGKGAFEKDWQEGNNYDSQSLRLQIHLKDGGNYGVCSGNGICCIDIDNPDIFKELGIELPHSFSVQRNGGKTAHYYFKCPDCPDDMKKKHEYTWGDVRLGSGYYTVGPNCIAPTKDIPPVLMPYEIFRDVPLINVPWELVERILKASVKKGDKDTATLKDGEKPPLVITDGMHHQDIRRYVGNQVRLGVPLAAIQAAVIVMNKQGIFQRVRGDTELINEVDSAWGWHVRAKEKREAGKERVKEERHILLPDGVVTKRMKEILDTHHPNVSLAHCMNLLIGLEAPDSTGVIRWNQDQESWFYWNGAYWEKDNDGLFIVNYAEQFLYKAMEEAAGMKNKSFIETILHTQSMGNVKGGMGFLKGMVNVKDNIFDTNPLLFNVQNGTIDLTTGDIKEFDKGDFITRIGNVEFDPDATAPKWEKHLELVIPDKETRDAFQVYMGYTMIGGNAENKALFLFGSGKNGKTETTLTIAHIHGSYSMNSQPQTFYERMNDDSPRPDIARMAGARFIGIPEGKKGKPLDEGLIKQLSGGDVVTARYLYGREFDFTPSGSLVFFTNNLPKISGRDVGIWRRIFPIPFKEEIPQKDRIKDYHKILIEEEGSGILNWMLEGVKKYHESGLLISNKIKEAKQTYKAVEDVLSDFMAKYVITGKKEDYIPRTELYDAYKLLAGGDRNTKMYGRAKFNDLMAERVGEAKRKDKEGWCWEGIRAMKAEDEAQKQIEDFEE